jgi:hypothetical protein
MSAEAWSLLSLLFWMSCTCAFAAYCVHGTETAPDTKPRSLTQLMTYVLFVWFLISGWRWQNALGLDANLKSTPHENRVIFQSLLSLPLIVGFTIWQWRLRKME